MQIQEIGWNIDAVDVIETAPKIPPEVIALRGLTFIEQIHALCAAGFNRNIDSIKAIIRNPKFSEDLAVAAAADVAAGGIGGTFSQACSLCLGTLSHTWANRGEKSFQQLAQLPEFQAILPQDLPLGIEFQLGHPMPMQPHRREFFSQVLSLPAAQKIGGARILHLIGRASGNGDWDVVEEVLRLPRASGIFELPVDHVLHPIESLALLERRYDIFWKLQALKVKSYWKNHRWILTGTVLSVASGAVYAYSQWE